MIEDTREEYERLRPQVPDIGGARNVFQPAMTVNGWIVALHRAMSARGQSAGDVETVVHIGRTGPIRKHGVATDAASACTL